MKPNRLLLAAAALAPALAMPGCEQEDQFEVHRRDYTYENLRTKGNDLGMGNYAFGIWGDGRGKSFSGGSPNLRIYENRNGGFGNTFDLIGGEGDCVYMQWAGNYLSKIAVREGWKGKTDRGLKIGDTIRDFWKSYSLFSEREVYSPQLESGRFFTSGHLKVRIVNGFVSMMELSSLNHETFNPNYPVTPIGPNGKENWYDKGATSNSVFLLLDTLKDGQPISREIVPLTINKDGVYEAK